MPPHAAAVDAPCQWQPAGQAPTAVFATPSEGTVPPHTGIGDCTVPLHAATPNTMVAAKLLPAEAPPPAAVIVIAVPAMSPFAYNFPGLVIVTAVITPEAMVRSAVAVTLLPAPGAPITATSVAP